MINPSEVKSQYQNRFKKYGNDPKSLFWKSKGAAHQRFRQFWAEIDFNNKSVLDVGCGFGEFGKFITRRYSYVNYKGVDVVPEFINEAKKIHPELNFEVGDYLKGEIKEKYDIVIASGILNSNVENNMEYRKKAIEILFRLSKKCLAFNMLGAHPQPENDLSSNTWYADSLEVLRHCLSITRRVIFRASYHPKDFTILMYPTKKR